MSRKRSFTVCQQDPLVLGDCLPPLEVHGHLEFRTSLSVGHPEYAHRQPTQRPLVPINEKFQLFQTLSKSQKQI